MPIQLSPKISFLIETPNMQQCSSTKHRILIPVAAIATGGDL